MKQTISQGEVKRKYEKLMQSVERDDYYKVDLTNRVNCYTCPVCNHITKTKDVDPGCTPAFFDCEECGSMASSTFYKDVVVWKKPTFEWYRPTLQELFKMRRNPNLLDHIFSGGLHYRKINS